MINISNEWPGTKAALPFKFVAQTMNELVEMRGYSSFQVRTLDVLTAFDEIVRACENVAAAGVDIRNVEGISYELIWKLRNDPIVGGKYRFEIEALENLLKDLARKNAAPSDVIHAARYIRAKISENYKKDMECYVFDNLRIPSKRAELRDCLSAYFSFLINRGYSRLFIQQSVQEKFFTNDIARVGRRTLSRFFSLFNDKDRKFRLWVPCNKNAGEFINSAKNNTLGVLRTSAAPKDVRDWAEAEDLSDRLATNLIEWETFARDRFSAVEKFVEALETARAMTAFSPLHVPLSWHQSIYVRRANARSGTSVGRYQAFFDNLPIDITGRVSNKIKRLSDWLEKGFTDSSKDRIENSLSYAYLAKTSLSDENRIISSWSAFEILVRNPPVGMTRIIHYREMITPIICRKYARSTLIALKEYAEQISREEMDGLLGEIVDEDENNLAMFGHLLVNQDYAQQNREFFERFADNPLMQFRLWDFRERFSKPKLYQASLNSHMNRVGWQIERIYRSRNELVHAGQKSRYLDSLGRNAESYFQMVVNPLIEKGRFGSNLDVDDLFAEFHIEFDAFRRKLATFEGEKSFPQEEIGFFFT